VKLHENRLMFQDAVTATAQQKGIPEIYIEKDYWVTFALFNIFKSEIGEETVFKGGTSLSKCFGLIQRFSEDVDLVVLKKDGESANQLKNKLKSISSCVSSVLPEIYIEGITNKFGMIRKTAHSYNKVFTGYFGQVRDNIIIESTWLGNFEPFVSKDVSSFIYEMMLQNHQHQIIDDYDMEPFEVFVLNPQRTFCEKIMSLVRFSHSDNPISDLQNKIRHTYDIHMMLKDETIFTFFQSNEFDTMLRNVANDDKTSFKNSKVWLANHPKDAIIFSKTSEVWNKIKPVYTGTFKEMVFGELPDEIEIFKTLSDISVRLNDIEWNGRHRL